MRPDYVRHLDRLTRPGTRTLLITLDYPDGEMQGPPFAVPSAEVFSLYGSHHAIEALCSEDRLAQEPRFREKGLTRLTEEVYRLERRTG